MGNEIEKLKVKEGYKSYQSKKKVWNGARYEEDLFQNKRDGIQFYLRKRIQKKARHMTMEDYVDRGAMCWKLKTNIKTFQNTFANKEKWEYLKKVGRGRPILGWFITEEEKRIMLKTIEEWRRGGRKIYTSKKISLRRINTIIEYKKKIIEEVKKKGYNEVVYPTFEYQEHIFTKIVESYRKLI